MVMVCLIDFHRKVGLGLGATKLPSGGIIRPGSFLRRIKSSKPNTALLPRIPDLSGVPSPWSLPNASETHLPSIGARLNVSNIWMLSPFEMHLLSIGARLNARNFMWMLFQFEMHLFNIGATLNASNFMWMPFQFEMHPPNIGARLNASNFMWMLFRFSVFKIKNNYDLYIRYNNCLDLSSD